VIAIHAEQAELKMLALALLLTLHPLEQKGVDQLYNLEFRAAAGSFEKLAQLEPTSPTGPHNLAATLWMEELARRGAMAGETFQSSRYWTRTRKQPVSPELVNRFESTTKEAIRRAKTLLQTKHDDREALYYLGATESLVSAFEATIRRRYFAAYRAGRRARNRHRSLIELDPTYADAYLVPGIFEYTLATLPRTTKLLAFLVGLRGSKEKGIRFLRQAAEEGKRSFWEARLLLTVVDTREKRYESALNSLRELEAAFPRNPFFLLEQGWIYLLRKDWAQARAVFEKVLARKELGVQHYQRVESSLALLRLGESLLFAGRFRDGLARFDDALAHHDPPETIRAMLHLRRGQAYDGLNERAQARAAYKLTISLNVDKASRRQAQRYMKTPFRLAR